MKEAVENLLRASSYDVLICQLTRSIQFLPNWYRGITVLNMVDPLIFNYSRSLVWRPWYFHPVLKLEIARLFRYESKHISRFNRIYLISKSDVSDYKEFLKQNNFEYIPYGIDTEYFKSDGNTTHVPGMIVITGNMGYAPNVDGVMFFCREVFPLILEQVPHSHLWLVGVRPTFAIKNLSINKNITVTGYVDDIRYYLSRAMVSVCPVRLNVGTQTKVLEALAAGTPVVTTSAGNQGIGGESGFHLYVADTPLEMAEKVLVLLRSNKANSLAESGVEFVKENFQWNKSAEKFELILNKLVTSEQANKGY